VIDSLFPFGPLEAARRHREANRHLGKIVLAMPACTPGKEAG
jgi:hypothetical protein